MWSILLAQSKTEHSSTSTDWSPDARTLTFRSSYCTVDIEVEAFRLSVIELPELVWQLFLQLFPGGFPQEQLMRLDALKISMFNDDPESPNSLFNRKDNLHIFNPYRNALEIMLRSEEAIQERYHERYRDALLRFQTALVYGVMACKGISMRSYQASQLRLSASDGFPRNVYIDSAQSYIGKPRPKQTYTGLSHYEAYWLLNDKVGLAILLYGGIFRPLEPALLFGNDLNSCEMLESPVSGITFLFVKVPLPVGRREFVGWDGRDINNALRREGSPLRAEARVYRQFTKALFKKYLSVQAVQISEAYSAPRGETPLPNSSQERRNLVLKRKMQLAFGISVHQFWGLEVLCATPDATSVLYRNSVLWIARHLVRQNYQLSGTAEADIREKVQSLLTTLPFMYGNNDRGNTVWQTLGDRTLIEVTAAMAYGPTQPSLMENIPYDGYPMSLVAAALSTVSDCTFKFNVMEQCLFLIPKQIWASIQEWHKGTYHPQQFSTDSLEAVEKKFTEKLIIFQSEQRPAWLKFCLEVYRHASRSLRFVDHCHPPYIVPPVKLLPLDTSFQDETYAEIPVLRKRASTQ